MRTLVLIVFLLAHGQSHAEQRSSGSIQVIYGEDNRHETIESSAFNQQLADSTAAMIEKKNISIEGNAAAILGNSLSKSFGLCKDERFSSQTSAAYCSGFLVSPNVIATAGHCIKTMQDCEKALWVFDFKLKTVSDSTVRVPKDEVYRCVSIIKQEYDKISNSDYALIMLDRKVQNHSPVKIAEVEPQVGTPLLLIGHPSGLPQKIDDGGTVKQVIKNGFLANLDAFVINSGSAVFNATTGELLGILVRGAQDYRNRVGDNCTEVNILPDVEGKEAVSSYLQFAKYIPKQ